MNSSPNHEYPFDLDIIVRVLDGYASTEDKAALEVWVKKNADNEAEFQSFKELWGHSAGAALVEKIDVQSDWEKVAGQLAKPTVVRPVRRIGYWSMGIAAGLALLVVAFFVLQNNKPTDTLRHQILADGTQVWLNQSASLTHPNKFEEAERKVTLNGEAYFEVAENPEKPFIIEANNTEVKVLGTAFNVKSLGQHTEVTVASGTVQFSQMAGNAVPLILNKNEKGSSTPYQLKKEVNTNPNFLSWKTGVFHFDNTDIAQVIFDLSSYYDKELKINSGQEIDCRLTADFEKAKFQTVLETLRLSCGLILEETDTHILIKQ